MSTTDKKCNKCRRAGEKLFLKGERCFTPKCAFERKPYPPGKRDSERKHRSSVTEFGLQLREKQKVRNVYRISEKQFSGYVKKVSAQKGSPIDKLYEELEMRIDSVVYRLGLARSRSESRQLVSHGHITVNGKRITIPSYHVSVGDLLAIRGGSVVKAPFVRIAEKGPQGSIPSWLQFDGKKLTATVLGKPIFNKNDAEFNLTSVMEFYSR